MEYTEKLRTAGISKDEFHQQLQHLQKGTQYVELFAAVDYSNALTQLPLLDSDDIVADATTIVDNNEVASFIPASGAASRMFKELYQYYLALKEDLSPQSNPDLDLFFDQIYESPLAAIMDIDTHDENPLSRIEILTILFETIAIHKMPKGLIPFHMDDGIAKTAVHRQTCLIDLCCHGNPY